MNLAHIDQLAILGAVVFTIAIVLTVLALVWELFL